MAALDTLRQILPPPGMRTESPVQWGRVEAALGVRLPNDYKGFADEYGPGTVDGYLLVYHPTTANRFLNLLRRGEEDLAALRALRDEWPSEVPYPLYPERGGLLPWGSSVDGDMYTWRAESADPNQWTVAVRDRVRLGWDEFPGSMTEFLKAILVGEYSGVGLPEDFPSSHPTFEP